MFQVWIKNEYDEAWNLTECETLEDVKDAFLESLKQGQPTMVTRRMEVSVDVKVDPSLGPPEFPPRVREPKVRKERKQEAESEATQGGPEGDQGAGDEGNGPV